MSDQSHRQSVLWAFSLALLAVVGAAATHEDLRLVDAAKNQDLQQVRALLNGHPDVNVRSEDGSTALLWAAHWNDLPTAELLVRAGAEEFLLSRSEYSAFCREYLFMHGGHAVDRPGGRAGQRFRRTVDL